MTAICRFGGHPWTEASTLILKTGQRTCRICRDEARARWIKQNPYCRQHKRRDGCGRDESP